MNNFNMYLIIMLDSINKFLITTGVTICSISTIIALFFILRGFYIFDDNRYNFKEQKKARCFFLNAKKCLFYFIIGFIISTSSYFIPTTKEMATMIILPKIINNKDIQKIPNDIIELYDEWFDKLKPKNK